MFIFSGAQRGLLPLRAGNDSITRPTRKACSLVVPSSAMRQQQQWPHGRPQPPLWADHRHATSRWTHHAPASRNDGISDNDDVGGGLQPDEGPAPSVVLGGFLEEAIPSDSSRGSSSSGGGGGVSSSSSSSDSRQEGSSSSQEEVEVQQSAAEAAAAAVEARVAAVQAAHAAGELGFGFSAGGFLYSYHLGVLWELQRLGLVRQGGMAVGSVRGGTGVGMGGGGGATLMAGASAGSLAIATFACGIGEREATAALREFAAECRSGGTSGRLSE